MVELRKNRLVAVPAKAAVFLSVILFSDQALALQRAHRVHDGALGEAEDAGHFGKAGKRLLADAGLLGEQIQIHCQLLLTQAAGKNIGRDLGKAPRQRGEEIAVCDPKFVRIIVGDELYQPMGPQAGYRPPDGISGAAQERGHAVEGDGAAQASAAGFPGVLRQGQVGRQRPGRQPVLKDLVRQAYELHRSPPFSMIFQLLLQKSNCILLCLCFAP